MTKHQLLFCILLIFPLFLHAQNVTVKGTIVDASTEETLVGASVVISDTSQGTTSDADGTFTLENVPLNSTLLISFIGYISSEYEVLNDSMVTIQLSPDTQSLDEYLVVGYGRQEKKVSTSSVARIDAENIEGFKSANVATVLEGQTSGLIVSESSGQPGAAQTMLIRGISTNGDNTPLYIVDGLQLNDIAHLSPSDIESIDVLKDAASSAIYGARGANGVVIITTKKGTNDKRGNITYEGFSSVSTPWKLPQMLNAEEYLMITREKFANGNQLSSLEALGFPLSGTSAINTNWMDAIFEPALIQNHRLSATTKNAYISLEYWNQDGVVGAEKSNYKRYALRVNSDKEITPFLKLGQNVFLTRIDNQNIGDNNAFGSVIADAFAYDPITGIYNDDKQYGFEQSPWVQKEYINPLSRLFLSNNEGHADQITGNVFLEFEPIEGLTFRSDVGLDAVWFKFRSFTPDYNFHTAFTNVTNDIVQGFGTFQTLQFENYLKYDKQLTENHHLDVVLGSTYRTSESEQAGGSSSSIPTAVMFDDNWQYLNAGEDTTDLSFGSAAVDYRMISYFGRVQYDYKKKYLFTATLRQDGSSNFGENNRWGLFPSFSLGWVLSKEKFFRVAPISFLKLRASWGRNGNDRIAPLSYAATIQNVFTYSFGQDPTLISGAALATPPNPNVKWEESEQIDLGLELELFEGKWNFEVDFYRKTTKDLLMNQQIPGYIGATNNPISNLGKIRNQGVELALTHKHIGSRGLVLNTTLTYTHFRNKVLEVAGESGFLQGWSWPVRNTPITRMTEGFPVGHFVGYVTDGIFQSQNEVFSHINQDGDPFQPNAQAGDLRFVDVNGDGVINSDDITNIGSPWPLHIVGLSVSAKFKNIDISGVFASQIGHDIFRSYERSDISFTNYQSFWLDRWTEENPSTEFPRLTSNDVNNNQRPSDFYVEDASFLRLRNLQIGYTIPQRLLKRIKLQSIRIYFSANNLFTLTSYKGFDPDIGTSGWILDTGIDKGFYPNNRTFGGGVKITL